MAAERGEGGYKEKAWLFRQRKKSEKNKTDIVMVDASETMLLHSQ